MSKWIDQIFEAKIAKKGGVVRRKKADVHYYASYEELHQYVTECGYHLIDCGGQYIVLCNKGQLQVLA